MAVEVNKALDRLAQAEASATHCRDGMICLAHALQRGSTNETGLNGFDAGTAALISHRIVQALHKHLEDAEVQRWGAAALEELFRRMAVLNKQDSQVNAANYQDAISALVAGARSNPTSVDLQRRCFSALTCVLTEAEGEDDACDSSIIVSHILEQDAMTVLAGAMKLHATSPSLLECALSLISCLVLEGGVIAADEAFRTGCLQATLSTLASTRDPADGEDEGEGSALLSDASLQQACLRALWAISESGELGVTEIAADSGLESVISILAQDGSAEVHKWCASVLQSMLAKGGQDGLVAESAQLLNAAEALVTSIACFGDHLEVVERCAAALATLAAFGPDAAVSVLEAGGLCRTNMWHGMGFSFGVVEPCV